LEKKYSGYNTSMDKNQTDHWKHFFEFLHKEIENVKCKIFIDDRVVSLPNRIKPWTAEQMQRKLCQDRVKLATVLVGTLQISGHHPVRLFEPTKITTNIRKCTRGGVEFEYNQYEAKLQLTAECITALKSLMVPENFRCTNPQARHHKLDSAGIGLCKKRGSRLFDGIYDYNDKKKAVVESHLDVYYEDLFGSTSGKDYTLTLTTRSDTEGGRPKRYMNDIANTGTEYIQVPCMKNFEQISSLSTKGVNILYGDNKRCPYAKTFIGEVLYYLTEKYCDGNTTDWNCHQPGVLHNYNSTYWHRSPKLAYDSWPAQFERSHYEIEYGDVEEILE